MLLLTVNSGSSSLKAALYDLNEPGALHNAVQVERIGRPGGRMTITDAGGARALDESMDLGDHSGALRAFIAWLQGHGVDFAAELGAVGHRVVHGGSRYRKPQLITSELVAELQRLVLIDPDHLPQALAGIEAILQMYPEVPQAACFDTAFHRSMPPVAQMYALPRRLWDKGLMRYGFHGLSCEYLMRQLRAIDAAAAGQRVIIAHLGSGASMTAVRGGVSVDTTMGFAPSGGLAMGTRCGDLDPSVLLYLLQAEQMSPAAVNKLVNREGGLLGVSESSPDMRDLLANESTDSRAAEAVDLFCYTARKFLGALVAVLGGLETLIFSAGIGEHAAPVRERICAGQEFLGIQIDRARNAQHAPIISRHDSRVVVRVMKTDEDRMIASHVRRLIVRSGVDDVPV